MNRTALKNYAPQSRREFIQAVKDQAAHFGLTNKKTEPIVEKGDVAIIGGRAFPRSIVEKRQRLEERIKRDGFEHTMEALAYTWFNRLVAIRFMELHGYFDHGYRVLSNPDAAKTAPEILEHAEHVDLADLKKDLVIELKLAGNKDDELYRLLLIAQCNALFRAMPFLFEKIEDETELLLPDNLLHSDSLIRKLVGEIDEADWQEVEIIGWLYQFYISERKDEVIGKVVASEDIPAATQLFTPNWIVKYLVQNTLGRQWLATYPQSALRQQMEYYIEPAEQTPEVQAQLKAITPTTLNPEELTLLDPACGSGHILVEAYDLFKAIYQERGYRAKDIPALILQKNLFGLEIDDRAAQLAAFALMMKARADDRRVFDTDAKPNVVAIQESKGLSAADITHALNSPTTKEHEPKEYLFEELQEAKDGLFGKKMLIEKGHVSQADIAHLIELFENAKTFGSLIQVPPKLAAKLPEIEKRLDEALKHGDLAHASAHVLKPLLQQARAIAKQYDAVVANPPFLGSKAMVPLLKSFAQSQYPISRPDTFSMFADRSSTFCRRAGTIGLVTPYVWMFIATYERFRELLHARMAFTSLVQLEYNAFEPACVPICAFTSINQPLMAFKGDFIRLSDFKGHKVQSPKTLEAINDPLCGWRFQASALDFQRVPDRPLAYWIGDRIRRCFEALPAADTAFFSDGVTKTGDNDKYLRYHWEPSALAVADADRYRFCAKGGDAKKYYGNHYWVIDWRAQTRQHYKADHVARITPEHLWSREGVTWTDISSSGPTFRLFPAGFIAETKGPVIFPKRDLILTQCLIGLLNSPIGTVLMALLNPTISAKVGDVLRIPLCFEDAPSLADKVSTLIQIAKEDWDSSEVSWDFRTFGCVEDGDRRTVRESCDVAVARSNERIRLTQVIEADVYRLMTQWYGLAGDVNCETANRNNTLHETSHDDLSRFLLSYAIGCMMGRYSLDNPGLIYAHTGNQSFDPSQYKTFRADDDGIIPLLETDWGIRDDATNRFVEFIGVAWPKEHLDENLKFVADNLGPTSGEQPQETIRRYLVTGFYKHHLSMYKKRPIYWLFSSGKTRAFQCLVYLHRYNETTLSRMRNEYVIPLQGKFVARIDQLATDIQKATSASQRKKLEKERDKLLKQQTELQAFDEQLRHFADQRIKLDLDDGVKVNYGKFGDLLAEVKAICGSKEEE